MTKLRDMSGAAWVRPQITTSGARRRRKTKGRERPEVEAVVSDGTPEGDLRAAQSGVGAATRAWAIAAERDRALERPQAVSDSEARMLGLGPVYSLDAQGVRQIDQVEVEIHKARTAREREAAALVLRAAREKLAAARVAAGNVQLAEATAAYEPLAEEVERRRLAVEQLFAELAVQAWGLNDALDREKRAKGLILNIAKQAAPSDEVRHAIDADAPDSLPADMTPTGPSRTIPRAGRLLFGGADPRKHDCWGGLVELILAGPKRGRGAAGKNVRAALDKAEARIGGAGADDATSPPSAPTPRPDESFFPSLRLSPRKEARGR